MMTVNSSGISVKDVRHMKIVKAIQTSAACPSQWDTWDEGGNYYYLRYRHGCGEMRQYKSENWVGAPWKEDEDSTQDGWGIRANTEYIRTVATFEHGDPLEGFITLTEFCQFAGVELDLTDYKNYGEHLTDEMKARGFDV
jgi:hypothetical protein